MFARKNSDALTSLVKKIDADKDINSFVVYLSDDEKLPAELEKFAETNKLSKTILAVDNVAGPKAWAIAKDAEVTVILYNKRKVEVNHAFASGKLDDAGVAKVVSDLAKIK